MNVYLDHAATSFPKPEEVRRAVARALLEASANPGRGSHGFARTASAVVDRARDRAARFFGIGDSRRLVFTKNATEGINLALKGFLQPGARVLISPLEHNAVTRPLHRLEQERNIRVDVLAAHEDGRIRLDLLPDQLQPPPDLLVIAHASNVSGALQPLDEIADLCHRRRVPILLDAAQSAGIQTIAVDQWNLAMLACSGHKGLLGPGGTGLLYLRPDLDVAPLIEGGTGSLSERAEQPDFAPDRYESGTLNVAGIAGLEAGIAYLEAFGLEAARRHELELARRLEDELAAMDGVRLLAPEQRGTATVSFTVADMNPADVGRLLDEGFGIAVRTGLHCAPLAHRSLGTFPEGTVRVSCGLTTTGEDIRHFVDSLKLLLQMRYR